MSNNLTHLNSFFSHLQPFKLHNILLIFLTLLAYWTVLGSTQHHWPTKAQTIYFKDAIRSFCLSITSFPTKSILEAFLLK